MAQQPQGWRLRIPNASENSVYFVRFVHRGKRVEKSTGERDLGRASVEAAKIYAEIVSGRKVVRAVSTDLTSVAALFLADFELQNSKEWAKIVKTYFNAHLISFFRSLDNFTPASYGDYMRARIQKVTRVTVRKEMSALRVFRAWCEEHGIELPPVPSVPRHGFAGVRAKHARKRQATIVTDAQAKRILLAMPERSRRTGEFVRPLFQVLYETGLRPTTVLKLEAPLHWRQGAPGLFVTTEIDKEGYQRTLPVSEAARAALDRVTPRKPGRLFGAKKSSLRHSLEAALSDAGLGHLKVSPYDFRHTRITSFANAPGPLTGASFLAGHRYPSTTAGYIQGSAEAAQATLDAQEARRASARGRNRLSGEDSGEDRPRRPVRREGT